MKWRDPDRLAVAVLLAIPLLGFSLPALLGKPLVPGDDLFQNFPLRVLAGQLVHDGHLPDWNRFVWSGAPLLGGLNAGALYPGTLLFAMFPPVFAWVLNEIAVYAVFATGAYALFRHQQLAPVPAFLGAATGTFAGLLAIHLCNLGLVQGLSFSPWIFLALEKGVSAGARRMRWVGLLAVAGGFTVLSGEPRAVSNVVIASLIYLLGLWWRTRSRALLALALAGGLLALGLGAIQIFTGLPVVAASQRAQASYDFFSLGSIDPADWQLQLVPYLLGKYATEPYALRATSLGYVGLLPLIALATFPFWWRRARGTPGLWLAMVIVGVALAIAPNAGLGELLHRLPLYGGQRMQYRNMGIAQLGLVGLFACWADRLLREARKRATAERVAALVAPVLVIGTILFDRWGPQLQDFYDAPVHELSMEQMLPYRLAMLVLALGCGALALIQEHLGPRVLRGGVLVLCCFDLLIGLSQQDLATAPLASMLGPAGVVAPDRAILGTEGRFALYDPKQRARDTPLLRALSPDFAGLHGLLSVQGFGSVVDARYWEATDAHLLRWLKPEMLGTELADELNLREVLVPESYLVQRSDDPRPIHPALVQALVPPRWQEGVRRGDLRSFINTQARGRLWAVPAAGQAVLPDAFQARPERILDDDGEIDRVSTDEPVTLVRSVAFSEGWQVALEGADGAKSVRPAQREGILQAVTLPVGKWRVSWSYRAPGARVGGCLSLLAAAIIGWLLLSAPQQGAREREMETAKSSGDPAFSERSSTVSR